MNKSISVMFDSNVYQYILKPEDCPKDKYSEDKIHQFKVINNALKSGVIKGFLSGVIYTIESINKAKRNSFFEDYKPKVSFTETETDLGIKISVNIQPAKSRIECGEWREKYLPQIENLNVKIIPSSRISFPISSLPKKLLYSVENGDITEEQFHKFNNKRGEVSRDIESLGSGLGAMKSKITKEFGEKNPWYEYVNQLSQKECSKFFSEWADGDAIAACIGFEIKYFCTEDNGGHGGNISILSPENKNYLKNRYSINIVNLTELVEIIYARNE